MGFEQSYETILNCLSEAVYVMDRDMTILYANPAAEKLTGYTSGDSVGKKCEDIFCEASYRCKGACPPKISMKEQRPILHREAETKTKDGDLKQTQISFSPFCKGAECIGSVVVIKDITDVREAEDRIKRQNALFKLTIDSLPHPFSVIDANNYGVNIANKACAPAGLPENWTCHMLTHHSIEPCKDKEHPCPLNEVRKTKKPIVVEHKHYDHEGMARNYEVHGFPILDDKGDVVQMIEYSVDISDRKMAEKALKENESFLQTIIETEPACIKLLAADGTLLMMNSAGLAMIEAESFDQVKGQCIYPLVAQEYREEFRVLTEDVFNGKSGTLTFEAVGIKGRHIWLETHAVPLRNARDEIVALLGVTRDVTERKRSEEALLNFQMAVDSAADAIGMSTPEGRHYYQNEAFNKLFGLSVSEVDGLAGPPTTVYADERVGRHIFDTIMQGREFEGEVKMLDKDRNQRDIHLRAYSIKNKGGKVVGLVGVHTDITDRRQAEDKLRKRESQLRESQEVARLGSWDLNLVSQELEWSEETYRLFDKSPGDFTPSFNEFARLVHPDDLETMQTNFNNALKSDDNPYHAAVRIINDSGREWIMEAFGVVRRDSSGKALSIFGTAQDITERKKSEEKIHRSEEFIRSILDTVDEGFIVVDRDYRILTANTAYCSQVGCYGEKIIGQRCYEISHKTSRPCYEEGEDCATQRVFETGKTHSALHRHKDPNGNILYIETKAFPIKDQSGTVTSVIETINNITEKHLLEEERLKTQKLESIGTLAGGIAHDFNNLLQGVFGYISMARIMHDQKEKSLAMLEQAEKALHMSVNLTSQLLTFSKGGKPIKKKMQLKSVIENSARFALSGSNIDLRIDSGEDLWTTEVDEGQIGQVIQNLVLNAEQAMPMGGTITISARNINSHQKGLPPLLHKGNYVEISIKDNGIGIPDQHLSKIFDPYFTTKVKGSGLGLATSYSIIKNHGGAIDVKSQTEEGATFSIYLPASETLETSAVTVSEDAQAIRKGRILLMDDEDIVRNIAGVMLRSLGHEVELVEDGAKAIERYREAMGSGRSFDIVIMDLTIRGGMGGEEAIKELLQIDPDIKAIVSSGYTESSAIAEYQTIGFKACLTKPYDIVLLNGTLNSLLR